MSFERTTEKGQGPDPGEDQGPDLEGIQESPLSRIYPCRYRKLTGCSFTGSPQELSAHYRREHRGDRQPTGNNGDEGGAPSGFSEVDPRDLEAKDLQKQVKLLELKRQELEKELKIRRLDPGYGRVPEDPELKVLTSLRTNEILEAEADRLHARAESYRKPWPAPPAAADPEVRELKEKVENLTQQLESQRFESLKSSLEGSISALRSELRNNESELKTLITSATDLAKTWISSPGPAAQIAAAKLGFKAVSIVDDLPPPASEESRSGVIEALRPFGLTGRIVEREKQ